MAIDNKYAPLIHDNASLLLRPKTGLNDMVVEVDPGTQSTPGDEGGHDGPARLDPAAGEPGRDPRITGRRHPAVPEAAAGERRGGPRPGPGPGREALQRAAPSRPVRARHLRRSAARSRPVARTSPTRSTTSSFSPPSSAIAIRTSSTSWTPRTPCSAPSPRSRPRSGAPIAELPATLQQTKGALTSANAFALQSGPALKKSIPGAKATAPALRALRPFFQQTAGPIQNQIRPFTKQVASPVQHVAQISPGPRHRHSGPEDRLHRPQRRSQRPRLQPARRGRGLPLLRPLAEPRPDRELHAAGRLRPDPPRPRAGELRDRPDRRADAARRALPAHCSTSSPASPARPRSRDVADGPARTHSRSDRRRGGLRVLVLRPAALPLGRPSAGRSR